MYARSFHCILKATHNAKVICLGTAFILWNFNIMRIKQRPSFFFFERYDLVFIYFKPLFEMFEVSLQDSSIS